MWSEWEFFRLRKVPNEYTCFLFEHYGDWGIIGTSKVSSMKILIGGRRADGNVAVNIKLHLSFLFYILSIKNFITQTIIRLLLINFTFVLSFFIFGKKVEHKKRAFNDSCYFKMLSFLTFLLVWGTVGEYWTFRSEHNEHLY